MATENQNVERLTRAIEALTRSMDSNGNSMASSVGQSGKYSSDDIDISDGMDKLSKAAEKSAKSIGNEMRERQRDAKAGFSDIVKRIGGSIINAMPFRTSKRIFQQGINNLDSQLSKASGSISDGIGSILRESAKAHKLNTSDFLNEVGDIGKDFKILTDISQKLAKNLKISDTEQTEFNATLSKLNSQNIDVIKMMGGTESAFATLAETIDRTTSLQGNATNETISAVRSGANAVREAGNQFSTSALVFSNTIDNGLKQKFYELGKAADEAGDNLKTSLKVAGGAAIILEGAGLIGATKSGFRGTTLGDSATNGFNYGQSVAELSTSLKENRVALRLSNNRADLMGAAGDNTLLPLYNEIRNTFSLIGTENTKFMGDSATTLMELGINPNIKASKEFRDIIQTMGSMDDKGPQEVLSVFSNMAKNKGFKAFFSSMNTGGKGLQNLFKSFTKLHSSIGLTIDEFVSLQDEYSAQRNKDAVTSIVEGAFAGKLASKLGFNSDEADLLRRGGISRESLNSEDGAKYDKLLLEERAVLSAEITRLRKAGEMGLLKQLQVYMERAGLAGQEMVSVLNKQTSGQQKFNEQNVGVIKGIGNRATGENEIKFLTFMDIAEGARKSPIGVMISSISGVAASVIGGALQAAILGKILTGSKSSKSSKSSRGGMLKKTHKLSGVSAGGTVGKLAKGIAGVGAILTIVGGINEGISAEKGKGMEKMGEGLVHGAVDFFTGIPTMILDGMLGTDVSGFVDDGVDKIGTGMRGMFGSIFDKIGGAFTERKTELESTVERLKDGTWTPSDSVRNKYLAKQMAIDSMESDKKAYAIRMREYLIRGTGTPGPDPEKISLREREIDALRKLEKSQETAELIAEGFKNMIELLGKGNEISEEINQKSIKDKAVMPSLITVQSKT